MAPGCWIGGCDRKDGVGRQRKRDCDDLPGLPRNEPDPDVIAAEIAEDLRAALEQFEEIAADLTRG